jgi:hypothetical protein
MNIKQFYKAEGAFIGSKIAWPPLSKHRKRRKGKGAPLGMSAGEIAIRAGNTVGWYDYTDATTLTDDGGGLISSWRDKLLSGHDLVAAGTTRPTLGATGVTFNGTTNFMQTATFVYAQPAQVYLAINIVTWGGNTTVIDGFADLKGIVYMTGASPNIRTGLGFDNGTLLLNQFVIIRILFQGVTSSSQVNALAKATGNMASVADLAGITIADRGGVTDWHSNIILKEGIFRNVADTAPDEAAIYAYLKAKHGI